MSKTLSYNKQTHKQNTSYPQCLPRFSVFSIPPIVRSFPHSFSFACTHKPSYLHLKTPWPKSPFTKIAANLRSRFPFTLFNSPLIYSIQNNHNDPEKTLNRVCSPALLLPPVAPCICLSESHYLAWRGL